MSDLKTRFIHAQQESQALPARPGNDTMLRLYALYKQATRGDATGERPSALDFVGRAKFDAWTAVAGTSAEDAMQQYIDLVGALRR